MMITNHVIKVNEVENRKKLEKKVIPVEFCKDSKRCFLLTLLKVQH
jgi:hypothetical protein